MTSPLPGSFTSAAKQPGTHLNQTKRGWSCSVPVILWRTHDDLLVQCSDCSSDNLQLVELDLFSRRITVLVQDGKHIEPQVVHPEPQCNDQ
jgi:hypothetical protein